MQDESSMMEREIERQETINELSELFHVVQEMGHRLAAESHGSQYEMVRQLNAQLHDIRLHINRIKNDRSS